MKAIQTYHPQAIPISIGGDHSITAMLVRGYKDVYPNERVGILQFDTHFDLRDPKEIGPANGTPIRQLIEDAQVLGEDVWGLGSILAHKVLYKARMKPLPSLLSKAFMGH